MNVKIYKREVSRSFDKKLHSNHQQQIKYDNTFFNNNFIFK